MNESRSKRVIVISNRTDLPFYLNYKLAEHGYYVSNALLDDDELEDTVRFFQPFIIIIALDAPAMEGIGLCLRLRLALQIPTLILSTWKGDKGRLRYLDPLQPGRFSSAVTIEEIVDRVDYISQK